MPFEFPTLTELLYRAWRLRRLIALGTALLFVVFALLGLLGLNTLAGSVAGLLFLTVTHLIVIGAHAILFPNAQEETVTITLLLASFALIMAVVPWGLVAVVLCLALGVWVVLWGQTKLSEWQAHSKPHEPTFTAKIKVRAPLKAVRRQFGLQPDSARGNHTCGRADEDGVFPVWFEQRTSDVFAGLKPSERGGFDSAANALDGALRERSHPAFAGTRAAPAEAVPPASAGLEETAPSFWAQIEIDAPEFQKTSILAQTKSGQFTIVAVVEHHFRPVKNGVLVTESDTPASHPIGISIMTWLGDTQADGLNYLRELVEQTPPHALRAAHRWSLVSLVSRWVTQRRMEQSGAA